MLDQTELTATEVEQIKIHQIYINRICNVDTVIDTSNNNRTTKFINYLEYLKMPADLFLRKKILYSQPYQYSEIDISDEVLKAVINIDNFIQCRMKMLMNSNKLYVEVLDREFNDDYYKNADRLIIFTNTRIKYLGTKGNRASITLPIIAGNDIFYIRTMSVECISGLSNDDAGYFYIDWKRFRVTIFNYVVKTFYSGESDYRVQNLLDGRTLIKPAHKDYYIDGVMPVDFELVLESILKYLHEGKLSTIDMITQLIFLYNPYFILADTDSYEEYIKRKYENLFAQIPYQLVDKLLQTQLNFIHDEEVDVYDL